ncbi:MAG: 50S ribosomal protein L4 [Acidobacteriota bacterium]
MNLEVRNVRNETVGEIEVPEEIFQAKVSTPMLQQSVKIYLANQRQGTACTKTRAEVSGSGRKLWKQKHTGRARVGSIRTPLWRHGGTVFGPRPRDYRLAFPKQMRRAALRMAVAAKYQDGKLLVLDEIAMPDSKTKSAASLFKAMGVRSALVLDAAENVALRRGIQNLKKISFHGEPTVHPYDILRHDQLIVSVRALGRLLEVIQ